MTLFAFFGVFGDGRFLNAKVFASGMEILSFVQTTPRKSMCCLATLILEGLILMCPSFSLLRMIAIFWR